MNFGTNWLPNFLDVLIAILFYIRIVFCWIFRKAEVYRLFVEYNLVDFVVDSEWLDFIPLPHPHILPYMIY